ncbi:glycosyltransferase family 4 protein [Allorhizobium taibaishanense]|uniref:Glycosyl transferase n=1 Tax=Allorhizobium taibaishanense TaxID=887144 RepID=A0A1Q8ZYU6_9HYPH|nr:glycosyltransferase family 4 protein [Allorhizobium taibaishanense]MBB4007558.1 glycosyltransferase involved in cell wall biosynthesis [Allorhizobium taibaishanense]OLP47503.1 glycosyl transferase [Allorhizobium taibaishanense]
MPDTKPDSSDENRALRIIHCFRSPVGGIFRHVRDLVEHHDAQGHSVGIICDSTTGGAHEDALFAELQPKLKLGLVRLPIRRAIGIEDIAAVRTCYRHIKSLQPDVLHGHGAKGGALARLIGTALRAQGSDVIRLYSPHGGSLHYRRSRPMGRVIFALERLLEQKTEAIAFVCGFEQWSYRTKVGTPKCTSRLILNGISESEFRPMPAGRDAVDFAFVGMLRDLKGPDVFIDAVMEAERLLGRPLSAVVIGDGPDRDRYERRIVEHGVGRRIKMLPAMRVAEAFTYSNIVVVPSRAESMPYIVLEAIAAGKSVIASAVGGIPEALGKTSAALVAPDNVEALAAVMVKALSEPGWRDAVMPDPTEFHARFSASAMANQMLDLYRSLLKTRAA